MTSAMNLKNNNWKKILKWVAWGVAGILFIVFFVRVVTFENSYFEEKHGSKRAIAIEDIEQSEELIEVEPTEEEVYEYVVPADYPRYLTIDELGVYGARILTMRIKDDGSLDTPNNIFDVGWYEGSDKPGQGGTMLIDGHNGGPHVRGVFKRLPDLSIGAIIEVERGDGLVYYYQVVENEEISLDKANTYMPIAMRSPEKGKESLTLITCSGEWSDERKTYLSRQFVRAVLVE